LQPADAERSHDVEQADRGDHPAAGRRRYAAIDQIGRQVHRDERELKAAGEEAEHQQHIGAMAERLRQRRLERLLVRRRHVVRRDRRRAERERQRHDQQHQPSKHQERGLPAEIVDPAAVPAPGRFAHYRELMHSHANPNGEAFENPLRIAALQIEPARPDNLAARTASGLPTCMLCLICSL